MATGDTASDPSPRPWPNDGGEGSRTFKRGRPRSWPGRAQTGSNIAKEHSRRPGKDAQEVRPSTVLTEYLLHYNTARPHRSFGQLAPAQAGTRPPEINLAEYRSAGNKSSADSRTSTRSPPDNPPRLQEESRSRPRSCIRAQQDRFWPSSRSPTPSTPRLALPGRPVHRGSCGIPIRGFLGQPEDQGLYVPAGRRAAGPAAHGPRRPAALEDAAAPAQDRVRGDRQPQAVALRFRHDAEQGREQGPVGPVEFRAARLMALQDSDLVMQK